MSETPIPDYDLEFLIKSLEAGGKSLSMAQKDTLSALKELQGRRQLPNLLFYRAYHTEQLKNVQRLAERGKKDAEKELAAKKPGEKDSKALDTFVDILSSVENILK